jgi:hypothetical protein
MKLLGQLTKTFGLPKLLDSIKAASWPRSMYVQTRHQAEFAYSDVIYRGPESKFSLSVCHRKTLNSTLRFNRLLCCVRIRDFVCHGYRQVSSHPAGEPGRGARIRHGRVDSGRTTFQPKHSTEP